MNSVNLTGNLTRDPELRYTPSNKAVVSFGLAINRRVAGGESEADFFDVEAWDKTAEFVNGNFKRGEGIEVSGRLKQERWEDKSSGQNRSRVKVVADRCEFPKGRKQDGGGQREQKPHVAFSGGGGGNEEIPF